MKCKILLYGFFFLIFEFSCKEALIKAEPSTPLINTLKGLTLSTTRYVANTGNDNYIGTATAPFLTIQKASLAALPGDTIIVKDGTYTTSIDEMTLFWGSGTADKHITYKAEHKWGAILDGMGIIGHCFDFSGGVSYIDISGFEIRNFRWNAFSINNPQNPNTNITIRDNLIHDIGRECTDTDNGKTGAYVHGGTDIIFERNVFHDIGRYAPGENGCSITLPYYKNHDHGVYIDGCNGLIARYNIFYNIQRGWGVHLYSGAGLPSSNISVVNNTFAYGNPYKDGSHILIAGALSNSNFKNNIFYGQVSSGISLDAMSSYSNVSINNNIAYGGDGLIVTNTASGVTLSNNITNTDALMLNPGNFDFRLQSGSPAINAGVNLGLTSDFLGNPIIGPPDIGAFESIVSSDVIGLNSIGGMTERGVNGFWLANSFVASSNIIVNRMNLYVGNASGSARLGIYSSNSGEPGTLIAQTGDMALSNGWNSIALGSAQYLTSGVTYWLSIELNSSTTRLFYNSAIGVQKYLSYVYGPLPDPAPLKCSLGTGVYSLYADYSNGTSSLATDVSVSTSNVSVSPSMAGIFVNATQQLTANVSPSNSTNKTVIWSSNNTTVATVNSVGLVTGVTAGNATITATSQDGNNMASSAITVISANTLVTGVSVSPTQASILVNTTQQQLTATISPLNATNKNVIWSSNNTNVATVNTVGLVTGVTAGNATITATSQDGNKIATSTITVILPISLVTGISVSPAQASILVYAAQQLTATVAPLNATNKNIIWSSNNTSTATVNSLGLVTGIAAGDATITATTQDGGFISASAITVNNLPAPPIGLNTIGGITERGVSGYWLANSYTPTSNVTINKLNIYTGTASGNARIGIYSSSSGEPSTLIAQTGEIPLTNGWNSGTLVSSQDLISGVTYWIAIELSSSATTLYYNTASNRQRYISNTYGPLPVSAPLKCSSGTGIYSVFAN